MKNKIKINAVGDVMLGDFPLTLGFGVKSSILKNTANGVFDEVKHVLKDCDICFGNLEAVLSDNGLKDNDITSGQMRGKPCFVEILKEAGFNVMSLANNHAMQHGSEAFIETRDVAARYGVSPVGVLGVDGRVIPHFVDVNGMRVCFLGYSLRPEKYNFPALYAQAKSDEIVDEIKIYKKICNVVILSLHWGDEFVGIPSPEQICNARSFVDAGASLVIGHHSHTIQGIEKYKNGLIAYSLGNFVFDFWQKKMRKTLILHCELSNDGVESFYISTVMIDKNFHPIILDGAESKKIVSLVDRLSLKIKKINTSSFLQKIKYKFAVKIVLMINKIENRVYFVRNLFKYEPWVVTQSFRNFLIARFNK